MIGAPAVTAKPSAGIATDSEKADALMRWQPVQWQAPVMMGGALTRTLTRPQRQAPSQGRFQSCMECSSRPPAILVEHEGNGAGNFHPAPRHDRSAQSKIRACTSDVPR